MLEEVDYCTTMNEVSILDSFLWLTDENINNLHKALLNVKENYDSNICLVIERSFPLIFLLKKRIRERAEDLFAHLRIWDTKDNCGVLIYINLYERRLELVFDKEIEKFCTQEYWQKMCDNAVCGIIDGQALSAIKNLLEELGQEIYNHCHKIKNNCKSNLINRLVIL